MNDPYTTPATEPAEPMPSPWTSVFFHFHPPAEVRGEFVLEDQPATCRVCGAIKSCAVMTWPDAFIIQGEGRGSFLVASEDRDVPTMWTCSKVCAVELVGMVQAWIAAGKPDAGEMMRRWSRDEREPRGAIVVPAKVTTQFETCACTPDHEPLVARWRELVALEVGDVGLLEESRRVENAMHELRRVENAMRAEPLIFFPRQDWRTEP